MAEVHSWNNHPDAHGVVRQAVEALSAGRLVAFPTETGCVLAADARNPQAVSQLRNGPLNESVSLTLAVSGPEQSAEVLPGLTLPARRLARRCWPGPVTLILHGHSHNLSDVLRTACDAEGWLRVRSPAHSAILTAIRELKGPLLTAALSTDLTALGDAVALAIDDGPCLYPDGETCVSIEGNRWEVVREGVVSAAQIAVQMCCVVVFVCTGNTCRSPLAEALCKKRLADQLGCSVAELPEKGFLILSAGVAAYPGDPAATNAVEVAQEYGADLAEHFSRALNPELVFQADHLLCMTNSHLQTLLAHYPQQGCSPRLLNAEGRDLADPVGRDESVYRECADQIWTDLDSFVQELSSEQVKR